MYFFYLRGPDFVRIKTKRRVRNTDEHPGIHSFGIGLESVEQFV